MARYFQDSTLVGFSYNSSVWVGMAGLIPVLAAVAFAALRRARIRLYAWQVLLAGTLSLAAVAPLALQEVQRLSTGPVIAFWLFPVVTYRTTFFGEMANFIAYWCYMLVLYFGALYVPTVLWAWQRLRSPVPWQLSEKALLSGCFLPLLVADLLHSVIANDDLGWRCILVSLLAMTVVAARVLTEQLRSIRVMAVLLILFVPGILSGIAFAVKVTATQALYGVPSAASTRFRNIDRAMWQAVDAVTPPRQAVASNPFYEQSLTPWPGNISWAMLSNRATCTPPYSYLETFAAGDTKAQQNAAFALSQRVFNGTPTPDDFKTLRDKYECRTLLVVPSDKLWSLPVTTPSPYFKLVAKKAGGWRIYRSHHIVSASTVAVGPGRADHRHSHRPSPPHG